LVLHDAAAPQARSAAATARSSAVAIRRGVGGREARERGPARRAQSPASAEEEAALPPYSAPLERRAARASDSAETPLRRPYGVAFSHSV